MVLGLILVVAAVLMSDSTASARERGGRRSRNGGGEQTYIYTYSEPTRVVYEMVPYQPTYVMTPPPAIVGYTTTPIYATNAGNPIPVTYDDDRSGLTGCNASGTIVRRPSRATRSRPL